MRCDAVMDAVLWRQARCIYMVSTTETIRVQPFLAVLELFFDWMGFFSPGGQIGHSRGSMRAGDESCYPPEDVWPTQIVEDLHPEEQENFEANRQADIAKWSRWRSSRRSPSGCRVLVTSSARSKGSRWRSIRKTMDGSTASPCETQRSGFVVSSWWATVGAYPLRTVKVSAVRVRRWARLRRWPLPFHRTTHSTTRREI